MIIEEPVGTASDARFSGAEPDILDIEWYNVGKRIDRRVTRSGTEVGIRLNANAASRGWRSGDVAAFDGKTAIIIEIPPCDCISVRADGRRRLARLCYEVGNRHAAFYYDERGDGFLLPYDEPMKVMLEKLGFDTNITQARLLPENRVSSPTGHGDGHEHGHSHAHEHGHSHAHEHGHSRAHSHTHEHGHVHHGADTSGDGDA